jgi:hypothetical protein
LRDQREKTGRHGGCRYSDGKTSAPQLHGRNLLLPSSLTRRVVLAERNLPS